MSSLMTSLGWPAGEEKVEAGGKDPENGTSANTVLPFQYERKHQISNGAFSSVFCVKLRGKKNNILYAAKYLKVGLCFVLVILVSMIVTNLNVVTAKRKLVKEVRKLDYSGVQ